MISLIFVVLVMSTLSACRWCRSHLQFGFLLAMGQRYKQEMRFSIILTSLYLIISSFSDVTFHLHCKSNAFYYTVFIKNLIIHQKKALDSPHCCVLATSFLAARWANVKPCPNICELPAPPSDSVPTWGTFWPSDFACFHTFVSSQHILIVQRQLSVLEEELEEFRLALRQYMECACAQTGCLQSVYISRAITIHVFHLFLSGGIPKYSVLPFFEHLSVYCFQNICLKMNFKKIFMGLWVHFGFSFRPQYLWSLKKKKKKTPALWAFDTQLTVIRQPEGPHNIYIFVMTMCLNVQSCSSKTRYIQNFSKECCGTWCCILIIDRMTCSLSCFAFGSITVQRLANESRFILYEFWEHNNVWKK